jgi:methionyl-tRNA formyltransferase
VSLTDIPRRNPLLRRGLLGRSTSATVSVSADRGLASSAASEPKRLVFMGTPSFAAECLRILLDRSTTGTGTNSDTSNSAPVCPYEIVAVVTQPPAPAGTGLKIKPSAVHVCAMKRQVQHILLPEKMSDPDFLAKMHELKVDMCITAAYGNYLPQKLLAIPKFGTLNIHPSLLPKYRGSSIAPLLASAV